MTNSELLDEALLTLAEASALLSEAGEGLLAREATQWVRFRLAPRNNRDLAFRPAPFPPTNRPRALRKGGPPDFSENPVQSSPFLVDPEQLDVLPFGSVNFTDAMRVQGLKG